ncbi:MAG: hypothetical protein IIA33_03795 [Planctomycetes bacterium]|nr:hypothetical protein [Planctomycetota bacterium]
MKRHKFFTVGSAVAATIGVTVIAMSVSAPRVSASEIFGNFKQAIGKSIQVTFKVTEPDQGIDVEGRVFVRKAEGSAEGQRPEEIYLDIQVRSDKEGGDLSGLDVHIEGALTPDNEWVYLKLNSLPIKVLKEEPMLAFFGAMARNGVVLKLDGLSGELHEGIFGMHEEILGELKGLVGELSEDDDGRSGKRRISGLQKPHEELAQALKALLKGEGTEGSLNHLIEWLEQHATNASVKEGRGGLYVLSAEGFAEIAGEHDIDEDERQILDKLKIQIAYTRDDGVQWATVDIPGLVALRVELGNAEIDPALFSSERYENDGVTQVFDMAGLMKLFAPQMNRRNTGDDS